MIIPGIDKKQRRRKEKENLYCFILYYKVIEVLIEIEMN